jgi:hypothetical protein
VRPIDERRDARVDALERAPEVRCINVVGAVVRRELVEDRPEVGDQREVRRARPDRGLPRVAVGVDEARNDDVAVGVDNLRVCRTQVRADLGDRVALDEDVGAGQLAQCRILGQDGAASDQCSFGHCIAPFPAAARPPGPPPTRRSIVTALLPPAARLPSSHYAGT